MRDPRDKIRNPDCELCPLHEEAEHVCLIGDGPIPTEVMILGEAPGQREDEQHRAFVGAAGKLLDEILSASGLSRGGCYISNVAKCRPPSNRTPTKGEIKTCVEAYLGKEIDAASPRHLLLLGNAALQGVTGHSGITKHRGKLHPAKRIPGTTLEAFATYHPAAILRNPRLESELRADVDRFARIVRGEPTEVRTGVKLIATTKQLRWLRQQLMRADAITFDIETYVEGDYSNLEDWHGDQSKIVSIGFTFARETGGRGTAVVVPLWHQSSPWSDPGRVLAWLKPALERRNCKYIGHNGKFDARWLARKGVFVPLTFDTMLAAHVLDENRPKGLKTLSQVILGADAYDVGDELGDAYRMPIKRLAVYNGKDCDYTHRLYGIFKDQLKGEPRTARIFTKLMMPASNMLTKVERAGIWVDEARLRRRLSKVRKQVHELESFMKKEGAPATINFGSPKQVAGWLFEEIGLEPTELTKTGAPSTKESVLLRLAKQHRGPRALMMWRTLQTKYINTYFLPWLWGLDANSRIHPTYKLFGTVTGRLSCVDPNLQQVPRNTFARGCFGAPLGWVFVEADYSQIELRVAAMVANERRMLRAFLAGEDIHLKTAVETTGKLPSQITSEERKKAKAINFGMIYGMGPKKFMEYSLDNYDVEVSLDEAQRVRKRFFESYPALEPWHNRQRRLANRYRRVYSPLGRVRHLPDVQSRDKEVRAEAERQAINSPIQSTASDICLLSAVRLDGGLPHRNSRIVGLVHDSILLQVREDAIETVLPEVKGIMEDTRELKRKFGAEITVPLEVEIKVGSYWSEGEIWSQ